TSVLVLKNEIAGGGGKPKAGYKFHRPDTTIAGQGGHMFLNRQRATKLGQETVRIIEAGRYTTEKGTVVEIGDLLRRAVSETCSYPPNHPLPDPQPGNKET